MKHYSEYRDSGVSWLGAIPKHWSVKKIKFVADVMTSNVDKHIKDGEKAIRLCNYVDVYYNDRITDDLPFMEGTAELREIEKFGLAKSDVLVTKDSESWDDIAVPAIISEKLNQVVCGYHLAIMRTYPGELDGEYLFRLLCSEALNYQFKISANGVTRFGLPTYALKNALMLFPDLEEQRAICRFLGRESSRIDALIEKKRRLLELLEEKRFAIITQAVTKGLDPTVPMKDSGIEWLGEVPAHWDVAPVSARYDVQLGKMLDTNAGTNTCL
ncbi:restriction endonuclease subunit S, partial [Candidatus Gottesmanbacteria bacterium]|nr:restriction endonuclease subunit S [Candidatus Gottesmanbacteria bacterium]